MDNPMDWTVESSATAFGDGNHPTTAGVLAALAAIDADAFAPSSACDMGCGSGILSLAIAAQFACPVWAVDVSPDAVTLTTSNARANGYAARIHPLQADGFAHPALKQAAPFDLIVMNILAEPLLALAADAEHHLAPGGALILSGLLVWQELSILAAYASLGLECTARIRVGDWLTISWQKP